MHSITDKDIFRYGLRSAIKSIGMSQKEFCDTGVTSTVTLSKILNGKAGTTLSMRHKLAERACSNVDEIMRLGRVEFGPILGEEEVDEHKKKEYSLSEIISKAITKNAEVIECSSATNKLLITANEAIEENNNSYFKMIYEMGVDMGCLGISTKIISKDLKITRIPGDPNFYFTDNTKGSTCKMPRCEECESDCLAQKILLSEKTEYRIFLENNCIEIGFPQFDNGNLSTICIVMVPLESELVSIVKALA